MAITCVVVLSGWARVASAEPPPLRVVMAEAAPAPGASEPISLIRDAAMSASGAIMILASAGPSVAGTWWAYDGVLQPMTAGGAPFFEVAGEHVVYVTGAFGTEVLWELEDGSTPSRLLAVGEDVGLTPVDSMVITDTDALGGTLILDGGDAILVDGTSGEATRLFSDQQEVETGWQIEPGPGVFLADDGEITVQVVSPDGDKRSVLHGPPDQMAVVDWSPLVPDATPDTFPDPFCCHLVGSGENGFAVALGNDEIGGAAAKVFRGLPEAMTLAFEIPSDGVVPEGGSTARLTIFPLTGTVVGTGGAFATPVMTDQSPDGSNDALIFGNEGELRQIAMIGRVVDDFTISSFDSICAVTSSYVIFNAGDPDGHQGVFAWDRQTHALEPWWLPGMVVPHPALGDVAAVNASCVGPTGPWEQGQALVRVQWEPEPGSEQYRTIILDAGDAPPPLPVADAWVTVPAPVGGRQVVVPFTCGNGGTAVARDAELRVAFVGTMRGEGCERVGEVLVCALGDLAPGEQQVVTVTFDARDSADVVTGTLFIADEDFDLSDNQVTFNLPRYLHRTSSCSSGGSGGSGAGVLLAVLVAVLPRRRRR